jgi:DNA-binding CsgD family transcriptional regulator
MVKLPSGLLPTDKSIEIFADPYNFGKCYFISEGEIKEFKFLDSKTLMDLCDELREDTRAMAALKQMGFTEGMSMLEQYNYCNRGALDGTADISVTGCKTREYVACGRKGRCIGEGKVCSPLRINGESITFRELECLRLIGVGLTYKRIREEMGFKRVTAVNSLIDRLRDKLQCCSNVEIALKVKELGIV